MGQVHLIPKPGEESNTQTSSIIQNNAGSHVQNESKACFFLDKLSPELRLIIYEFALYDEGGMRFHCTKKILKDNEYDAHLTSKVSPSILFICRQIRAEARTIPFKINKLVINLCERTFRFAMNGPPSPFPVLLGSYGGKLMERESILSLFPRLEIRYILFSSGICAYILHVESRPESFKDVVFMTKAFVEDPSGPFRKKKAVSLVIEIWTHELTDMLADNLIQEIKSARDLFSPAFVPYTWVYKFGLEAISENDLGSDTEENKDFATKTKRIETTVDNIRADGC